MTADAAPLPLPFSPGDPIAFDAFFSPRSVAVIGATDREGSVGRTVLWNLLRSPFGGTVYPVNPRRASVLGVRACKSVAEAPEKIDLAVVVTPAPTVPDVISQCAAVGVRAAIVLSAGFRETGADGAALERDVLERVHHSRIRLIGPNCLGVMNPHSGLNATFAAEMARPGSVAFISQSGALCTAVLDWSLRERVGFSAFVSVGSMLDVGWGDLIDHLGEDPRTRSIVIYMESVGDARSFLSAAREVALRKPVIVIKAGRTEAAAKAAVSHTGALTVSDDVLDAAFRRAGVLRVDHIEDLFYLADVLAKQPRPEGPRLAIVTNAGGPGVLATDALIRHGGQLAPLSNETRGSLNAFLPPHWSRANPVDILGDADPDRYAKALDAVVKDETADGVLVVLTPQAMTDPTHTAAQLRESLLGAGKPVLASWMGGDGVADGQAILRAANVPTFDYPDTAVRVFAHMWRYSQNLKALYETPEFAEDPTIAEPRRDEAASILRAVADAGRKLLTETESKSLLAAYGLPVVPTTVAATPDAAAQAAQAIGFPVALKLHSTTVTHKAEVGGVELSLRNEHSVRNAFESIRNAVTSKLGADAFNGVSVQPMVAGDGYEIIVGSSLDPQFGPVLLFGAGGSLVEVFRDRSLGLPPLNVTLARRMMERTRIHQAMSAAVGRRAADLPALERFLVRFSQLVLEQPRIASIDINPVRVTPSRVVALDARVILHPADADVTRLARPAIRPYPTQYQTRWTTRGGTPVLIRPIRPEDEPLMVAFHATLSERSVYFRYFHPMKLDTRVAHERLSRLCFIDYDREIALVAVSATPAPELMGIARIIRLRRHTTAEFSILISDKHQRQGLGTQLMQRLLAVAKAEGITRVVADIHPDNTDMENLVKRFGFTLSLVDGVRVAELAV